jgi:hypothetical protein
MTSKEFVVWMQGFVEACNDYSPTPKQWDTLKDKLGEVKDEPTPSLPFGVPNTAPSIWQHPHYVDPYKITCGTTGESGTTLTVSSGSSGTITYNPSTTTLWNPSGSNWSYTSTLPQQPTTGSNQLELEFEKK